MTWTELPIEIKLAMFLNQTLQGNAHNKEPFEKKIEADKDEGGFYWESSIEGEDFWIEILEYGNISHFYTKYPKIQVEADCDDMEDNCILSMAEERRKQKGQSYSVPFPEASEMFCEIPFKDVAIKRLLKDKIKQTKKRLKALKAALEILLEE